MVEQITFSLSNILFMATQENLDGVYMRVAMQHATLSKAVRLQVGACLVTDTGIIIPGYNGTPSGTDNVCEYETADGLVTKPSVLHAELNCILKGARDGVSIKNSTLYVTHAPCIHCSAMMVQCHIKRVVFLHPYRLTDGVDMLQSMNVHVEQFME